MKTITMSIDEETLSKAEQKSAALATSISEVVADYLRRWTDNEGIQQARTVMAKRFAKPDWQFALGTPDDREQRNART
jgi:hypothetical protein